MSAHNKLFTLALTSPEVACIAAWLHNRHCDSGARDAHCKLLDAFAAHLDDAGWIGRWLREEARLVVSSADCAALSQALAEAIEHDAPTGREQLALQQLLSELERVSRSHSLQLVCSSSTPVASLSAQA